MLSSICPAVPLFTVLFNLALTISAQNDCKSDPLVPVVVPIRNVTLANQVLRRGIALSVGTPPQDLAFNIVAANNTFIFDGSGMCAADITPIQCAGMRGGFFNEAKSSTWSQAGGLVAAGGSGEESKIDTTNAIWGHESFQLNSDTSLNSFPFAVSRTGAWDLNSLGLGRNSTMLNALYSAGLIASRSWSIFYGLIGGDASSQMDGSLVLGGYDAAKVTGENFTDHLTVDPHCSSSVLVTVTDIVMNHPDGSQTSIIGTSRGAAMKACIGPETPVVAIPLDVWSGFSNNSGGTYIGRSLGIYGYGMVYAAQDVYAGSLTITIASKFKVTIPNSQLVVPDISINNQGTTVINSSIQSPQGTTVTHASTREILLLSMQGINANDMPILGTPFLTSAYLSVDNDAGTFTLWESKATRNQSLVSFGTSNACSDTPTSSSAISSSSPSSASSTTSESTSASLPTLASSTSSNTPLPPPPAPARLSTGAIAGTAAGGVALCTLALGIALWFRRRSIGRGKASNPRSSVFDGHELPPDNNQRQELPWRTTVQELPWRSTMQEQGQEARLKASTLQEAPPHRHENEMPAF